MIMTPLTSGIKTPQLDRPPICEYHRGPISSTADLSHFYVVAVISNPVRYKRRYELYWHFKAMVESAGVKLITVELAYGNRPYVVTETGNIYHCQVRTSEELWFKENLINIGIRHIAHIDPNHEEITIAWVDADCFPMCPARHWFEETWHQLQHYEFVQMWEYLVNFGPDCQPVSGPQPSFMACYAKAGYQIPKTKIVKHTLAGHSGTVTLGRPGLAWASHFTTLAKVGGLLECCILGSGDWHMAHAMVGGAEQGSNETTKLSEYAKAIFLWQERCERWVRRDVGFVPITVGHWWHGKKENRQYGSRGQILIRNRYNPFTDLKHDFQGLLQLECYEPRQIRLRDQIRQYFRARNEDSIDV